jgi:hypothetical protein
MFCPSCGFEYTQKINYCKRCGESLSVTNVPDAPKTGRWILAVMFCAVAAFSAVGMLMAFMMYNKLANRGLRGDELILPFMMGMMFTGAIAGLLIWQLARLVTAYQKGERNVVVEKHFIRETPPAQLGAPADPYQQAVEPPSVVEHTTRQFAGKYK